MVALEAHAALTPEREDGRESMIISSSIFLSLGNALLATGREEDAALSYRRLERMMRMFVDRDPQDAISAVRWAEAVARLAEVSRSEDARALDRLSDETFAAIVAMYPARDDWRSAWLRAQ